MAWECVGARLVEIKRVSFEEYDRNYLLELASAAVVRDCVGARLLEIRHV